MPLVTDSQGRSVVPLIVGGETLPLDEARIYPVISAASGETCHFFQSADTESCDKACDAAWKAFTSWKSSSISKRRDVLTKTAEILQQRTPEIAAAMIQEISCHEQIVFINVGLAMETISITAAAISEIRGMIPSNDNPSSTTFVFKEPIGPVLVIAPWNAPLLLALRAIAGVIATGCTVVLKASEICPLTQQLIVDMLKEAGLPDGVVNFVAAPRQDAQGITETLIANKHIRKIDFIGSNAVGRIVASIAAKNMKPIVTELGGKNAFIVLEDADLDRAATTAAISATMHHGQFCVSADRIIVNTKVAEAFTEKLVHHFENAQAGTAAHKRFADNVYDLLKDAHDKGAEFLCGKPTDICHIATRPALVKIDPAADASSIRIIDEETFGPCATLHVVEDDDEAIDLANRSDYGLNAAIHTANMARGLAYARELECGQVVLNGMTFEHNLNSPFSSVKGSGWGRTCGVWHLENFYVDRTVTWNP